MLIDICKVAEEKILLQWVGDFLKHHTLDSIGTSRTIDDEFLNPSGTLVQNVTKKLFHAFLGEDTQLEDIKKSLTDIIRLQAVQDLSPAQALLPFISLKQHIFLLVEKELNNQAAFLEYKEIIDRIDTVLLMAFDLFAQKKEELYRVRVKELKSAQSQILRFSQSKGYST